MSAEFKRYRSGNCWVTAAVLTEDELVEVVGEGYSTVSSGMVLIVTANAHRFDVHSQTTFFDLLGFEEVPVETVVNVPDEFKDENDSPESEDSGNGE